MTTSAAATVLFVGIGGQGVLSAARFLGAAAHRAGMQVVVSQLHGMSQRGGSVQSSVEFGTQTVGALRPGPVDVLVGLELLETLRSATRIGPRTLVLCDRRLVRPPSVSLTGAPVPTADEILARLASGAEPPRIVEATALATAAGAAAASNVVLLGALAELGACPVTAEALLAEILAACRPATRSVNERAFAAGRAAVAGRTTVPRGGAESTEAARNLR